MDTKLKLSHYFFLLVCVFALHRYYTAGFQIILDWFNWILLKIEKKFRLFISEQFWGGDDLMGLLTGLILKGVNKSAPVEKQNGWSKCLTWLFTKVTDFCIFLYSSQINHTITWSNPRNGTFFCFVPMASKLWDACCESWREKLAPISNISQDKEYQMPYYWLKVSEQQCNPSLLFFGKLFQNCSQLFHWYLKLFFT